jgi:hypothetical protein
MKINYDLLDEQYDSLPSQTPIRGNSKPQGSLTDNLRMVKPNRDGAIRRAREMKERGYGQTL